MATDTAISVKCVLQICNIPTHFTGAVGSRENVTSLLEGRILTWGTGGLV